MFYQKMVHLTDPTQRIVGKEFQVSGLQQGVHSEGQHSHRGRPQVRQPEEHHDHVRKIYQENKVLNMSQTKVSKRSAYKLISI